MAQNKLSKVVTSSRTKPSPNDWITDPTVVPRLTAPESVLDFVNYHMDLVGGASARMVHRLCEGEFGITRREWRILAQLSALGEMAPSEIAVCAGLDRSRTSKLLMSLLSKRIISRKASSKGRVHTTISLTPEGQALYERVFPQLAEINTVLLSSLSQDDIDILSRLLAQLRVRSALLAESMMVDRLADRRGGGSRKQWDKTSRNKPAPSDIDTQKPDER